MTGPPEARLAFFLSGSGRTLNNLLHRIETDAIPARIVRVIASADTPGSRLARDAGIPTDVVPGALTPDAVTALIENDRLDLIVLGGYLKKLPIPEAARGRVLNIHPSLLPRHGGPGMYGRRVHQAVLDAGETESGCTVHLCDDQYDTGPVLLQMRCPVLPDDTATTLAARVFELECNALPDALVSHLSRSRHHRSSPSRPA